MIRRLSLALFLLALGLPLQAQVLGPAMGEGAVTLRLVAHEQWISRHVVPPFLAGNPLPGREFARAPLFPPRPPLRPVPWPPAMDVQDMGTVAIRQRADAAHEATFRLYLAALRQRLD